MTHVALFMCYLLVLSSVAAFAPSANTRSRFMPSTSLLSMSKYGGGNSPSDVYGSESFQEHLPELLKRGLSERPDYELPKLMRARYEKMVASKKEASRSVSGFNLELSEENSELAAEMEESHERFEAMVSGTKARDDFRRNRVE